SGWTVLFRKDLKELYRNKRALALVTLMPLLLFAGIGVLSNLSLTRTPTVVISVNQDVGVGNSVYGTKLTELINAYGQAIDMVLVPANNFSIGKQYVNDGKAALAFFIPQNFSESLNSTTGTTYVEVYYNPSNTKAQVADQIVSTAVAQISSQVTLQRVSSVVKGNASNILNPIQEYVSTEKTGGGGLGTLAGSPYAGMLPALIVLLSVETNLGLIVDSLIGEKERKTLEMLMATPVGRWNIIVGKTGAVLVISLFSAIGTLLGLLIEVSLTFSGLAASITPTNIGLTPFEAAAVIGVLAATVTVTQLLTAAMSAYATNTKEANASIGLVMALPLVTLYPLLFSSLQSLPLLARGFMLLFPFTYSYLLLNSVLIGPVNALDAVYIVVLLAFALTLLWITVRLYGRESVIVGGTRRTRRKKSGPQLPQSSNHLLSGHDSASQAQFREPSVRQDA
ncbi:MAG: ABC transporter permease, partial [Thermoprotei archaeon]